MCYCQYRATATPSLGFPSPITLGYEILCWEKRKEAQLRTANLAAPSQLPQPAASPEWQQLGKGSCFQCLCSLSWTLCPINLGSLGGEHPSEPHGFLYDGKMEQDRQEEWRGYVTEWTAIWVLSSELLNRMWAGVCYSLRTDHPLFYHGAFIKMIHFVQSCNLSDIMTSSTWVPAVLLSRECSFPHLGVLEQIGYCV